MSAAFVLRLSQIRVQEREMEGWTEERVERERDGDSGGEARNTRLVIDAEHEGIGGGFSI